MGYDAKDVFEEMARRYDTGERVEMAGIIARAIRSALADTQAKKAMDYGCGTGLIGLALNDLFASMLLVDTSPQMIAQVDRKIESAHIPHATTLCADFTRQAPPGIRVDCILLSQVLLHVPDCALLLRRLHGLLSPAGQLILVDFDANENVPSDRVHPGFDQASLLLLLQSIGFASTHAHTFFHGQKIFMNQDASLFLLDAAKEYV